MCDFDYITAQVRGFQRGENAMKVDLSQLRALLSPWCRDSQGLGTRVLVTFRGRVRKKALSVSVNTRAAAHINFPHFLKCIYPIRIFTQKKKHPHSRMLLFWRKGRDSNPRSVISRTHDFQSCALDQLSHLCVCCVYLRHYILSLRRIFPTMLRYYITSFS